MSCKQKGTGSQVDSRQLIHGGRELEYLIAIVDHQPITAVMFFDELLQCDNLAFAGHRTRLDLNRNHTMIGLKDQINFGLVLCAVVIVLDRFDPVFEMPDQLFADKCFPDTTKLRMR